VKRNSALRRIAAVFGLTASFAAFYAKTASADVTLWKPEKNDGGFEVFTNGRIGIFASYAHGDGYPQANTYSDPVLTDPTMPYDPVTNPWTSIQLHSIKGGGGISYEFGQQYRVPYPDGTLSPKIRSSVDLWRLRSGFTGNVFGVGLRRNLDATTRVTAYVSYTAIVDATSQKQINNTQPPAQLDAREGYVKIEGLWGAFTAGRTGTLFNRGAVTIDFLYLHNYGLGFPGDFTSAGSFPTAGMIGFGVLANGFAAGFTYSTPVLAGLQLNLGLYDPSLLTGSAVERTKEPRGEFEATAEEPLGTTGKLNLYVNGGIQRAYRSNKTDDDPETIKGYGFGGRVELGPVHIGAGGHRGTGISTGYIGAPGEATYNDSSQMRDTSGYFVIGQVVLGQFAVSGGYGQSKIQVLNDDLVAQEMPVNPATGVPDPKFSWLRSQTAFSGAIVYNVTDWFHLDVDAIFTTFKWNLGEQQQINFYNFGTTLTW
jgi:hypothetical protein